MSFPPLSLPKDGHAGTAGEEAFEGPGTARISLSDSEVHVWLASLDPASETLDRLLASLSDDERTRADGFRFRRDRDAYVAGRGMLRGLLGRYLQRPAEEIVFSIGPHGKPSIADSSGGERLRFNVSALRGAGPLRRRVRS